MMLIRTYRVRGHLAADLDPLGLTRRDVPADLTPAYHDFGEADLDRPIWICGALGFEQATVRADREGAPGDLLRPHRLRIYAHQRGRGAALHPGPDRGRRRHRPVHARRQAVDPDQGDPRRAVGEIPRQEICRDQALRPRRRRRRGPGAGSGDQIRRADGRRGDRRRHGPPRPPQHPDQRHGQARTARSSTNSPAARPTRPTSAARATSNITSAPRRTASSTATRSTCRCCPTRRTSKPSTRSCSARRARCRRSRATSTGKHVLPILLHGDAAFAGQGVVWECLSFSGLPGYGTGGTIHFIINNQVGFTTSPQFARSSPYPSDVAKGIQAPILHVNGDDPEAVTFCCKLATEFRQTFGRDIVIDMWCYRRFGHNEGDEPSFTQPLMYAAIKKHPPISQIYGQRLIAREGRRPGVDRPADQGLCRAPRGGVRSGDVLPAQQGGLVRRALGRAGPPRRAGARPPQHRRPRSARTSCSGSARC